MELVSQLVDLVKQKKEEQFKEIIPNLSDKVIEFTDSLHDQEKELSIVWCRQIGIYLLHKMFTTVTRVESVKFIQRNLPFYKESHFRDERERTWLHVAVRSNRSNDILNFLVKDIAVDVEKYDMNKFTALHNACMKQEYIPGELDILIQKSNQLVARSFEDISPLELACGDMRKLNDIKKNKIVQINDILCQIDRVFMNLPDTEDYYFNDKMAKDVVWTYLLRKNDKYRLINSMKKDVKFNEKYYFSNTEFVEIFGSCQENGQGILTYIKNKYFNEEPMESLENVFNELTGIKIVPDDGKESVEIETVYYKSGLFLALITGRLELVPPLLTYVQFDIIPYGLITCLICRNLSAIQDFPDQVVHNITKLKTFCEKYSVAVINRTVIRDLTPNKQTIHKFLNKPHALTGQRILDIAYLGKSSEFLGLPSCQESLTKLWYKKDRKCPALKFYLHSAMHCIFLGFLSYILVDNFYSKISTIEILCYVYGFGYMIEEARRIYLSYRENGSNIFILDIGSVFFMLISVILRLALTIENYPNDGEAGLFRESQDVKLFCNRLVLCISLILFFMRVIYFGSIFEQLGPKLKMIGIMIVRDLIPLIFIFLVFIGSFGVAFQSLMFPNSFYTVKTNNTFERKSLRAVFGIVLRRSAITIFDTHYPFEELEHDEGGYIVNNEGKIAVYFLLIVYMTVVNIMLTNLLIALFSYTVTAIIQRARESWKANRYKDIKQYYQRSLLPPPINLLEILFEITYFVIKRTKSGKEKPKNSDGHEMLILDNVNTEIHQDRFTSFKILQAFALKDCRYKLMLNEEDEKYELKIDIKTIKNGIKSIEKLMKEPTSKTTK